MKRLIYQDLKVSIPTGVATYRVDLDFTVLEALAYRAAHNKSGRSVDGPLTVMITKREERFPKEVK